MKARFYLPILFISGALGYAGPVLAVDISGDSYSGSLDTTISYGIASRVQKADAAIIGRANGGRADSVNGDDGNLNYHRGVFSHALKVTSEMELDFDGVGAFIRATAFYDIENENGSRQRSALSAAAKEQVGSDIDLLDAYLWKEIELAGKPGDIRLGNQLLSWGESTFIQNSINTINPVDVAKVRVPGAELREALTPVPMLAASLATTENTSAELFYQLDWQKTEIDPAATYFSTSDFAGAGGERVMLGFGAVPDTISAGAVVSPPATTAVVLRAADDEPADGGQFGVAFRYFSEPLNNTEFGIYFINYHSRLPLIGAQTGTAAATVGVDPNGQSYVRSARYMLSYPEDIKLYGASFNTLLQGSGIALQGELSYRQDVPLQIDDVEILFAALGAQDNVSPGNTAAAVFATQGQLGAVPFETVIPGYIRRDVAQAQLTATKVFGPSMGASSTVLLGEAGITKVLNMPDKNVLRLEAPGTYISGNPQMAALHYGRYEAADAFADASSWGYRLLARWQYDNVVAGINLLPRIAWQHDVNGVSPGPAGNFIAGRKAVTLGLGAVYQHTYSADISYTVFSGAGRYNLIRDRDFIAANVKYSF